MPKGISLHIGINQLKKGPYRSEGYLRAPENDARAMAGIAVMEGYQCPTILLTEQASRQNVLSQLDKCIQTLEFGDSFLLSFSGHGGQIEDSNGDETDAKDETWCLYDGPLIDDELLNKWYAFKEGVQIIVVSNSCHSRTAIRVWNDNTSLFNTRGKYTNSYDKEIIINNQTVLSKHLADVKIKANIIHLSACDDKQQARDGDYYSRYTDLLLKHWNYGRFEGSYAELTQKIAQESGYLQEADFRTHSQINKNVQNYPAFKLTKNINP